jgi:hypothetical protein
MPLLKSLYNSNLTTNAYIALVIKTKVSMTNDICKNVKITMSFNNITQTIMQDLFKSLSKHFTYLSFPIRFSHVQYFKIKLELSDETHGCKTNLEDLQVTNTLAYTLGASMKEKNVIIINKKKK